MISEIEKKLWDITTYPTKVNMAIPSNKWKVNYEISQNYKNWLMKIDVVIWLQNRFYLKIHNLQCCDSSAGNTIEKWAKFAYHMISRSLTFLIWWWSQKSYLISLMFFDFSRRFLHSFRSFHSLRVSTSSASATPKGDPGLRSGFRSPSFISLTTFVTKSLFKIKKITDIKGFLWYHQS